MALDSTMTEQDMDAESQNLVRGFRGEGAEYEPDFAVDGLSESILSRLLRLFGSDRS